MTDQLTVTTPTGRTLRVHTAGDPAHPTVFVLHGSPSSGMLYPPNVKDAAAHGLRLVSYDRPGYGGSTPHPGRTVGDAAADVLAIADHLGARALRRLGPLRRRAARAGLRRPAGRPRWPPAPRSRDRRRGVPRAWIGRPAWGRETSRTSRWPWPAGDAYEARLVEMREELLSADEQGVFEAMQTLLSPVDRAELTGEIAAFLAAATAEGLAPGVDGMRDDDQAFVHPWGFDLATIPGPLRIYHGHHDRFVPVSHGEWLAAQIPAAEAHISEDDGHLTLYTRGARECHAWFAELLAG